MEDSKEKFTGALTDADPTSKMQFYELFNNALELFHLSAHDVTRRFNVSVHSVDKWKNHKNAPHPLMRQTVYEWFRELISTER